MPKLKALYRCQECGATSPKWAGQCAPCSAWNSMVEEAVEVPSKTVARAPARSLTDFSAAALPLPQIETSKLPRRPTGIGELDRLLGGGFVPG
ncbi:MAG: DNA repair protein RadA, partial [Elusimicrobiota bacterium]